MPAAVRSTGGDRGCGVSLKTYDPAEVAELAKVTRRTVYNWIASGVLPATKAGPKLWRVTEAQLRAFLTGRGSEPDPEPKRKWQGRPKVEPLPVSLPPVVESSRSAQERDLSKPSVPMSPPLSWGQRNRAKKKKTRR